MQKTASSRSFGLLFTAIFLIIAGLAYWAGGPAYIYWTVAATTLLLISLLVPRVLGPLKRLWVKLGTLLHLMVSPLILGAVYLLVFVPVGMVLKLFGKDLLSLKHDPKTATYWIERGGGPAAESLKDQF